MPDSDNIKITIFPEHDIYFSIKNISEFREPRILPAESELIASKSPHRIREFLSGRSCAREAMANLNYADAPILVGPEREPVWPKGIIGSISHSKLKSAAVIASDQHFTALGLDIERIKPLRYDISRHICTDEESKWLAKQPKETFDRCCILLFSLKESIYKAVFQATKVKLGFKDCSIIPDSQTGRTLPELHHGTDKSLPSTTIIQRYYIDDSHIYCGTVINK